MKKVLKISLFFGLMTLGFALNAQTNASGLPIISNSNVPVSEIKIPFFQFNSTHFMIIFAWIARELSRVGDAGGVVGVSKYFWNGTKQTLTTLPKIDSPKVINQPEKVA